MSNRRLNQFFYTPHVKPVKLNVDIPIGATGAVGTLANNTGITSVTRLAAGQYKIKFADNYNKFLGMDSNVLSDTSGSSVLLASLNPTSVYQITVLGSATAAQWITAGVPVGTTAAVGVVFLCAATSAGASSACELIATTGIQTIEVAGDPNKTISSSPVGTGYIVITTMIATDATHTALIAGDPTQGSTLQLSFYFNDSSLVAGY